MSAAGVGSKEFNADFPIRSLWQKESPNRGSFLLSHRSLVLKAQAESNKPSFLPKTVALVLQLVSSIIKLLNSLVSQAQGSTLPNDAARRN